MEDSEPSAIPLLGRGVVVALLLIVGLCVAAYPVLYLWVLPRYGPSLSRIDDPNITVIEGEITDVHYEPHPLKPGQRTTFDGKLRGSDPDLVEPYENHDFSVKVWWVPQDNPRKAASSHYNGDAGWVVPGGPGAAMSMLYLEGQRRMSGNNYVLTFSDPVVISVPEDIPVVVGSPVMEIIAEGSGRYREEPYVRIVVKVTINGSQPDLVDLVCTIEYWVTGVDRSGKHHVPWSVSSYGGSCGLLEANGTTREGWAFYVAEPRQPPQIPEYPDMGMGLPPGKGTGLVVCWVAGRDNSSVIHFAKPLIIPIEIPE